MSDESPPKKSFLSRILPSTVASIAAVVTFCVLLLTLIVVWIIRWSKPELVPPGHAITWTRMAVELLLTLFIPIVLYWGIRRWNQVVEGVYPDIDQAWESGLRSLRQQGVSISELPVFLVLGSSSSDQESYLVNALETESLVHGIPDEPGLRPALRWYASPDAIYVFCAGSSALSALAQQRSPTSAVTGPRPSLPVQAVESRPTPVQRSVQTPPKPAPQSTPVPASQPAPPAVPAAAVPAAGGGYVGTIGVSQLGGPSVPSAPNLQRPQAPAVSKPSLSPPAVPRAAPSIPTPSLPTPRGAIDAPRRGSASQVIGTVSPEQLGTVSGADSEQTATAAGIPAAGKPAAGLPAAGRPAETPHVPQQKRPAEQPTVGPQAQPSATPATTAVPPATASVAPRTSVRNLALPSALDTSQELPRLRYVCKLLKRIRRPRCGINGIVALIPFGLSRDGPLHLSALAQAARGDVSVVQDALGIRFPLTVMLDGLEQDRGFNELVQRLQPELLSRRLGGRFDLRSRPTPEELNAHSDRLCDAFEDWVYRLFGRTDALAQQRGNRKLYGLISRIRHELKPRLRIVLGEAFGCEATEGSNATQEDDSFFFSGCYFAASGVTTGQPAFVKGVLRDKLLEEQSQVEWTRHSLRMHNAFRAAVLIGWVAAIILAGLLLRQYWGN